ncbi:MAG: hypothetical protein LCH73_14830 [Proteobacteria bacterium]|nr:hypothetical protein [Pseudomonadota bacterium]
MRCIPIVLLWVTLAGPVAAQDVDSPGCEATTLAAKAQRFVDPLEAPAVYDEVVYGAHRRLGDVLTIGGLDYRVDTHIDEEGGYSATVLRQVTGAHALLVLQGMNRWFADRGGFGDAMADLGAVFGGTRTQSTVAERQYLALACDDSVGSLEVIGYSLGSQSAYVLALRHGAQAVVFGDMGLPSRALEGLDAAAQRAALAALHEQVVSLRLSGDVLVRLFGASERPGRAIDLPGGLGGLFHQPEIYRHAADTLRGVVAPAPVVNDEYGYPQTQ